MDESRYIVPALERATHAVALLIERAFAGVGMTQAEAHVLGYLAHVGPCAINDLHRSFGHKRSTLTSIVDRLERRGFVQRGPHPASRRLVQIQLTDSGQRIGERVDAVLRDFERAVAIRVSDDDSAAFLRVIGAIEGVAHERR